MIRVLIIDEVPLISNVLAAMLKEEPDIRVVGCVTNLDEATPYLDKCNLALVSTTMPDDTALKLIRSLTRSTPSIKTVAVGLVESEETVLPYLEAGIAGYVLRDDTVEELLQRIRAIYSGEALISSQMVIALMQRVTELKELCDDFESNESLRILTSREREVLDLLQQNLSNQEIAEQLVIELGTVKNHVHNILKKLNLNSRHDVSRFPTKLEAPS
jgi:two-component system, NarL family, nitrate/nitrite response regulator NarL